MKMPRSNDRGTIAGRATIAGRRSVFKENASRQRKRIQSRRVRTNQNRFRKKTRQDKNEPSGRRWRRRMKYQGVAVHAVAQPGRLRPVVEHVPEMAAAAAAVDFGPQHAEGPIFGLADGVVERLVEARPAGAALELGLRGEQRQVATGTGEDALAMLVEQRARTRPLGALLAQDVILLRRQLRAPFRIGLFDLELLGGLRRRSAEPAEGGKAQQAG